ncbi:hypothetical protein ACFVWP_46970 [Streptomyces sp. NPDC058175]|uniref:hypothetical protein n=1 Tax=Streptomyces sp. NPDC058175 TaxID=3346367 RepID=UPI0036F047A3
MTHRTHSSFRKATQPKSAGNAAARRRQQQASADQAVAEGQSRPEPGQAAPLTYDEHFALRMERIKEQQEKPSE